MQNAEALSPQQISEFLKGSAGIEFAGQSRAEIYAWTDAEAGEAGVCAARQEAAPSAPI